MRSSGDWSCVGCEVRLSGEHGHLWDACNVPGDPHHWFCGHFRAVSEKRIFDPGDDRSYFLVLGIRVSFIHLALINETKMINKKIVRMEHVAYIRIATDH